MVSIIILTHIRLWYLVWKPAGKAGGAGGGGVSSNKTIARSEYENLTNDGGEVVIVIRKRKANVAADVVFLNKK